MSDDDNDGIWFADFLFKSEYLKVSIGANFENKNVRFKF